MSDDEKNPADKIVGSTDGLGACGHFCEACARRDDEIKRLRDWLRDIHILMRNAYGNSSFHPRVANMAKAALDGAAPNAVLSGADTTDKPLRGSSAR